MLGAGAGGLPHERASYPHLLVEVLPSLRGACGQAARTPSRQSLAGGCIRSTRDRRRCTRCCRGTWRTCSLAAAALALRTASGSGCAKLLLAPTACFEHGLTTLTASRSACVCCTHACPSGPMRRRMWRRRVCLLPVHGKKRREKSLLHWRQGPVSCVARAPVDAVHVRCVAACGQMRELSSPESRDGQEVLSSPLSILCTLMLNALRA